jgi:hypothetical protein
MKIFISVFFAILASAAVIVFALQVKVRLSSWEQDKQIWYSNVSSELGEMDRASSRDKNEMTLIASLATSVRDQIRIADMASQSIGNMKESQRRLLAMEREIVQLLEHKPFHIPLTGQEKRDLDSAKAAIDQLEKTID